jgi:hypothetical protein
LPPINEDIAVKSDAYLHYAPLYTHMWKNILKDGVVSSDYEILSEELWAMIKM